MNQPSSSKRRSTPLEHTLNTTQTVTADVRHASDHLSVINTVLEQGLPEEVQVGDVAQAIDQTDELKDQLAQSADALEEVNAALEEEVRKRKKVVEKLDATQAQVKKLADEAKEARS